MPNPTRSNRLIFYNRIQTDEPERGLLCGGLARLERKRPACRLPASALQTNLAPEIHWRLRVFFATLASGVGRARSKRDARAPVKARCAPHSPP